MIIAVLQEISAINAHVWIDGVCVNQKIMFMVQVQKQLQLLHDLM